VKTALITGVSGGIGKAIAQKFLEQGYFVIGQYNDNEQSIIEFKNDLQKQNLADYFFAVKADLSNSQEIDNMMNSIKKSFKTISVLVNNCGIALYKLITDTTEQEWDKLFEVNVKSAFLITNRVLDSMISAKHGKIVNISSMWGVVGSSMEVAYSASKSTLIGYTKALAKEVGLSGINVNCVCPGVIKTPMIAHLSKDDLTDLQEQTPLSRLGEPCDVANLVYFLCSEQASFITGQVICCDGGFSL